MRHYIVTTTKFADRCLYYLTYGASQSNWLANIASKDIIFLSQFNYRSQNLFGPLRVNRSLFYNKDIIYPQQKYFYRIQFEPVGEVKIIEETDLYLQGIQSENINLFVRIVNLIQQNKHLHCITLTNEEGQAISETFRLAGLNYQNSLPRGKLKEELQTIDRRYLWEKNRLDRKNSFSSESDLESYLILSLKDPTSREYINLSKLFNKYDDNHLQVSEIYNQFIFGNAYPSDLSILNKGNVNVLELKKDKLTQSMFQQLGKEIKKHLYYSMFSERVKSISTIRRFNFYIFCAKHRDNVEFKESIGAKYRDLCRRFESIRENTITFVEYSVKDSELFLEEI